MDAVLTLVMQSDPAHFNARLVSAACQRLAQNAARQPAILRELQKRPKFQRLLSLARKEASQMGGQGLATVAWALADLKCSDKPLHDSIEGESYRKHALSSVVPGSSVLGDIPACMHTCRASDSLLYFHPFRGLNDLRITCSSPVSALRAARALTQLSLGQDAITVSEVIKLTCALRRARRPARQVFHAAGQWLAERDALAMFSDQNLGKFAMGFDEYMFDSDTQVSCCVIDSILVMLWRQL